MRIIRPLLIFACLSVIGLMPTRVFALDQSYGGNNSSDYQPPTGNPQTNLPTSLQPTNIGLQPVTSLNQQGLLQSGGLSVLTAPDKGATSTASEPVIKKPRSSLPIWIVGSLLTLAAVVYILFKPDKVPEEPAVPQPATAAKKVKTEKSKNITTSTKKAKRKKKKSNRR